MDKLEKVNKLLKIVKKKYSFYKTTDNMLFVITPKTNCEAVKYCERKSSNLERALIWHLINILKEKETKLKYSLFFKNSGLSYDEIDKLKNVWEEK